MSGGMRSVMAVKSVLAECELILGNSNPRFSGVTSTMLQTLVCQKALMSICVLGAHHLDDTSIAVTFWDVVRYGRVPREDGRSRVFHARRNNEMIQALLLKYLFRVPIKIVFTSTAQRYHSWLTRWLMSKMDAVLSTCDAAASYLAFKPAKIIPHGIQAEVFSPAQNKADVLRELGFNAKNMVGIFGRVRPQKGVHLFVRACIQVLPVKPDYIAVVVGAISPENQAFVSELQLEVDEAGLSDRILFLGEQPFSMLPKLFSAASLVAALSCTEGFGLTVLEAMSSGAAVLATEAGAWPEVVRDGVDGYIVPVENQSAVSEKLGELLADNARLLKMGESGRARVLSDFTVEREARALCDFFRCLQ